MKKSIIRISSVIMATLIIVLAFASCGSSKSMANESIADYDYNYGLNAEESKSEANSSPDKKGGDAIADSDSRKLIRDASLTLQTKDFDKFNADIEKAVKEAGGYISESDISGSAYDEYTNRDASMTLRIPTDKFDEFIETVGTISNMTSKNISVRDITSDYIDVEAQIEALESERSALLEILKKADKIADIIEVQNRLSDVNAELISYKNQLKAYDNLVTYSTIKINVYEVKRISANTEKLGFFAEIKEKLGENLYNLGQSLRSFIISFISSLPYIIIWGIIIAVVVIILRKIIKKRKAKKKAQSQD